MEKKKKKDGLQLLSSYRSAIMGFAALCILFFHEWQFLSPETGRFYEIERILNRNGYFGVDIFLFLSGIGVLYAISKGSVFNFYYRRIKRVYLPFLIMGIILFVAKDWTLATLIKNVTGISFYAEYMYMFLWFIPAILTLYLLFPIYYRFFSKASNKLIFTATVILIWFGLSLVYRDFQREDLFGFINRIPVFLIGVYVGWLSKNQKVRFDRGMWCFLWVMLLVGVYSIFLANFRDVSFIVTVSNCFIPTLLIALSLPFIAAKILDILNGVAVIKKLAGWLVKILEFYGRISLELYCVQEALAPVVIQAISKQPPAVKNLAVLAACTAAGLCLHYAVNYFWIAFEAIVGRLFPKSKAFFQSK